MPLCIKNLWKEADAHFKYRRLHKQHPEPTHKNQSFITHDLICIWSFFSVLTIFIDFFFLWEISYPDGGARAKNRANKNRRGLGETLPNHPPFFARPTFSFRPRFTMWTLRNKLVLNFVVCLASLRLWKDSIQFLYVESNIDNTYSSPCRWLAVEIYRAAKFFLFTNAIYSWICKQKNFFTGFIGSNFQVEFRHLLRVFREQLVWLFVTFLCCCRIKAGSHFARNLTRVSRRSFVGGGGESMNSTGYPECEQPIRTREKHYPLF